MYLLRGARAGLILAAPFLWAASYEAGPGETRMNLRLATLAVVLLALATRPKQATG